MVISNTWNVEWLNQNSQRSYPLAEGVSSVDTSESIKLPNDFIVDLYWPVNAAGNIDITKFHISSVANFGSGLTIELGYEGSVIGLATINKIGFTSESSFIIVGVGDFESSKGLITIGNIDSVNDALAGAASFELQNTRLESSIITRSLHGVSGIAVRNNAETSDTATDDIVLQAGIHTTIEANVIGDVTELTFNAIEGAGEQLPCVDCDNNGNTIVPLLTINGIGPDDTGNFAFAGDDCIEFESITNGLIMVDTCSEPCCGCDDLITVEAQVDDLRKIVDSTNTMSGILANEVQSVAVAMVADKTDGPPTETQRMVDLMQALLDNSLEAADCELPCSSSSYSSSDSSSSSSSNSSSSNALSSSSFSSSSSSLSSSSSSPSVSSDSSSSSVSSSSDSSSSSPSNSSSSNSSSSSSPLSSSSSNSSSSSSPSSSQSSSSNTLSSSSYSSSSLSSSSSSANITAILDEDSEIILDEDGLPILDET